MRLAALFSGGKDSTFAIYDSLKKNHDVGFLISMISENPESYMFHYPNIKFTSYQAESMGIPIITKDTKGEKEKELEDLKKAVEKIRNQIDGILAGGLASKYQYNRIRVIADFFGLKIIVPYWNIDPVDYWKLLLNADFRIMIIAVACEGLGKDWLGRIIDRKAFEELRKLSDKHRFNLAGEGGEYETFVLDCPLFRKRLEILDAETVWNRDSGFYLFKKVKLAKKD